jgi:hypothetical protein
MQAAAEVAALTAPPRGAPRPTRRTVSDIVVIVVTCVIVITCLATLVAVHVPREPPLPPL